MDQGVHNYVIHKGLVPRARLVANGEGPVLTAGLMEEDDAVRLFRERAGSIRVVHQYDRLPRLAAALQRRSRAAVAP